MMTLVIQSPDSDKEYLPSTRDLYKRNQCNQARRDFPNIPFDVLDAVLSHGGTYTYSVYTISRKLQPTRA